MDCSLNCKALKRERGRFDGLVRTARKQHHEQLLEMTVEQRTECSPSCFNLVLWKLANQIENKGEKVYCNTEELYRLEQQAKTEAARFWQECNENYDKLEGKDRAWAELAKKQRDAGRRNTQRLSKFQVCYGFSVV